MAAISLTDNEEIAAKCSTEKVLFNKKQNTKYFEQTEIVILH